MVSIDVPEQLKRFEIPGRVTFLEGNGEMTKIEVITDWSTAEIYLHGAHVTDFQKKGEAPLLFTSQFSRFARGQPIRGGIPVIFPNASADQSFCFESCLHTYLAVGDIDSVGISGLKGAAYLDKVENVWDKVDTTDALKISGEVDRVYHDTTAAVEILDSLLRRKLRVEKSGSASTVVWNPGPAKAQQMPDFGNEEYRQMVCVESGNVAKNKTVLPPGRSSVLKVTLSSAAL